MKDFTENYWLPERRRPFKRGVAKTRFTQKAKHNKPYRKRAGKK